MNQDLRNLLLAIVLSIVVLTGWHFFVEKPRYEASLKARTEAAIKAPEVKVPEAKIEAYKPLPRKQVVNATQRVMIKSEKLSGSISLKGMRFDDLTLLGYKKNAKEENNFVELLSPSGTDQIYFTEFGWVSATNGVVVPDANSVWSANQQSISPGKPVIFTWNNGHGLVFSKTIELDENYLFKITQSVTNQSGQDVYLAPYGLINRTKESYKDFFISHEGVLGVFDNVLFEELSYNEMIKEYKPGEKQGFEKVEGWLGMADKYWLTAIIPPKGNKFNVSFSYNLINEHPRYQAEYLSDAKLIPSGQKAELTNYFYAGAKIVSLLDRYSEQLSIPLFDRAVDFGWLYFMTKPIFISLNFFEKFLNNFGLAILLLTVCIKLLLFPLANKGYISMNKLKALQPQLVELRNRHKDDKVKLQQEMMALYKRERVNPMSGCLPILIQLPIFFSLYKVLFVTIEMRHADFYGWIHDLSAPDPTTIFNLFGLLPFTPPGILMIGAWPLIMMVTMIIQQKLNPPPPDPVQASVIKALPFLFVFMFAQFPAGLIIYWAWSNTLSILQQWMIAKVLPAKRQAKEKLKS